MDREEMEKKLENELSELTCDDFVFEDEETEKKVQELARLFYFAHGYCVEEGYDFADASHPQEQNMYGLAVIAFNYVRSLDQKK